MNEVADPAFPRGEKDNVAGPVAVKVALNDAPTLTIDSPTSKIASPSVSDQTIQPDAQEVPPVQLAPSVLGQAPTLAFRCTASERAKSAAPFNASAADCVRDEASMLVKLGAAIVANIAKTASATSISTSVNPLKSTPSPDMRDDSDRSLVTLLCCYQQVFESVVAFAAPDVFSPVLSTLKVSQGSPDCKVVGAACSV